MEVMTLRWLFPVLVSTILLGCFNANGQTDPDLRSWEEVAKDHLSEDAIGDLKKNEMVLVDEGRRQVFSNYINSPIEDGLPFFISYRTTTGR